MPTVTENIKILVIENDDFVINDIRQMLKSCGFAPPRITHSGEEGLRFIESFDPDLVVLGLVLQGSLDGIEVYEHIHSEYDIPVIFLTERDEIDILKYVGISDCYGYLFKPFIERELYANIRLAMTVHNTEKKLHDSEDKFKLLTQSFPATIYLRKNDEYQSPLFLGDSISELTGFRHNEFMNGTITLTELIHPDELDAAMSKIQSAIESQSSFSISYRIHDKNGSWQWVRDVGNPVFHDDKLLFIEGFMNKQEISTADSNRMEAPAAGGESFANLLDICTDTVVVHHEGKISFVNNAAKNVFGVHTKEELIGKRILDYIHPDYHKIFKDQVYYELLDTALKFHREKFVRKNGTVLDVELAGSPVFFDNVPSIQLIIRDISAAVTQEAEQRLAKDHYSMVQNATHVGYWDWDVEVDKLHLSPHAEKIFEVKPGTMSGSFQEYTDMIPDEDRQKVKNHISACLEMGKNYHIEHGITDKSGSIKYISVQGNTIRDWQGKVVRIYGIMLEITQYKSLEEKIRHYRKRLDSLMSRDHQIVDKFKTLAKSGHEVLEQGSVILLITETEGDNAPSTTYVSPNIVQFGAKGDSLLSGEIELLDIIHPEDRERAAQTMAENMEAGLEYWEQEYRIITGVNDSRWVNESTHLQQTGEDQQKKTFFTFLSDVTPMKAIQQELQEKQNQLIHSGRLASLGELAAGVAHELNQPLAIIQSQAQILQIMSKKKDGLDPELKEDLEVIIEEVDRASEIIENMRDFSKVEYKMNGDVDLIDPIEKSLMFFKKQFLNHNIELETNYADVIPKMQINPQRFEQIIINFMTNARYAVEKRAEMESADYKAKIELKLYSNAQQGKVILEVSDNGIGMNEDTLKNCREPFYTTKKSDGTGLGLSIVSGIVKEFKGELEIDSEVGLGTTMRVLIPDSPDEKVENLGAV